MSQLKIISSGDGSHTLYNEELDEHYHSVHGAIQEALHVFIQNGLDKVLESKREIRILEIGFGTGLNALCTLKHLEGKDVKVEYFGLEAYPVTYELAEQLNYLKLLGAESQSENFEKLHKGGVIRNFDFHLLEEKLEEVQLPSNIDLIYYDAFGPRAQGEMWDISLFDKCVKSLAPNGVFVTYCAKGQVRRDLASCGLTMERLPGPPGKREMLRGTLTEQ